MNMYRNFSLYKPDNPLTGVLYIKDVDGKDWYDLVGSFSENTYKIVINSFGIVMACNTDASSIFPVGFSVVELSELPKDFNADGSWLFDGVKLLRRTETKQERIDSNSRTKTSLLSLAEGKISILERAVKLGMDKEGDKSSLEAWERYSIELDRIDVNSLIPIDWPTKPEN